MLVCLFNSNIIIAIYIYLIFAVFENYNESVYVLKDLEDYNDICIIKLSLLKIGRAYV